MANVNNLEIDVQKDIKPLPNKIINASTKPDRVGVVDVSMNNEYILETDNVSLFYRKKQALKNLSIKIKRNSVSAFIGPSGCGKSTILRLFNRMNDLIPHTKLQGAVLFNGKNIYGKKYNIARLRTDIGMIFQKPTPFPSSIYNNVVYGPLNQGIKDRKILNQIVVDSLKKAAIWEEVKDVLHDSALSLSGGQQQRVCIARAIAMKPKVLLMDEPTSALDPIATARIENLIRHLRKDFTIVIVTHNMQQAARISDHTSFFLKGELIEAGPTKKLFSNPDSSVTEDYITGRF